MAYDNMTIKAIFKNMTNVLNVEIIEVNYTKVYVTISNFDSEEARRKIYDMEREMMHKFPNKKFDFNIVDR